MPTDMIEPDQTWYCTWCDEPVDTVYDDKPGHVTGVCDDDGIVYVTTEPDADADAVRIERR